MAKYLGMVTALLLLALVGPPARGQDSLLMTCAQHGTGVMTLKFVREAGPARNVEVLGQASNTKWTVKVNGQDATPRTQTLISPGIVAVHADDIITFKVENPRHGILFLSEELARGFLGFDEAAGKRLDSRPPKGEFDWGTDKFNGPDDVLAVAKVRDGSADGMPTGDEQFLAKLSPSVQRRLLRFLNRAFQPEDLIKSPQSIRTQSEHARAYTLTSNPDTQKGFSPEVAETLIADRPLNGYRDVSECLPAYNSSAKLDELSGILESLGPRQFGQWDVVSDNIPSVMHAAMMNNGKVVFITDSTATVVWDPNGVPEILSGIDTGLNEILYCSGHSFLSDGRLLAVGGGGSSPGRPSSIHGWKFDPAAATWTRTTGNMAFRRWYPTAVTLGDESGRVLVAGGSMGIGGPAPRMEVYSESTDAFEEINATGPAGDLLFDPTYPGLHLLPGGEIFHAPTGFNDCDQAPITSADAADPTAIFQFTSDASGAWTKLAANNRLKGMSVLLFDNAFPFVEGLVVGGGEAPRNGTAQTINLSSMAPAWSPTFPLLEARVHPNLVVLPDGTVFICGGKEAGASPPPNGGRCELYDPKSDTITEMDELTIPRHYHSVALLLPDGRVMAAGGAAEGGCTISEQNPIEVFSPPYLFRGSRPKISSAARFVAHGGTIEIKCPTASEIDRVVLARPGAVTHQTDSEQRILPLSFKVTGPDSIEAIAPGGTGANPIAPRGYYMLFILDQQGVPSVSTWIYLGVRGDLESEVTTKSGLENLQIDSGGDSLGNMVAMRLEDDVTATAQRPARDKTVPSAEGVALLDRNQVLEAPLVDKAGNTHSLREYSGRPHIVVLIKGAFCKYCMEQLAEFQQQLTSKDVAVVVVTPVNDLEELADLPYDVFADPDFNLFKSLNAFSDEPLHGTFVFNARGETLLKNIGSEPFTDFAAIKQALKDSLR